eukprot:CAMPEP_0195294124 /NCGR_PEP_ID=MMETSP0707-20130614/14144_1 /TAXON_ID=33640 /ORGANISM="Asterionellopsis glacialis, Strain CCMP134" /LENGTH=523 /DNA_ID=CAMNT_0040355015 /DNA_START=355 /DNA_END=1926 /DNA_ORIENTATION=+
MSSSPSNNFQQHPQPSTSSSSSSVPRTIMSTTTSTTPHKSKPPPKKRIRTAYAARFRRTHDEAWNSMYHRLARYKREHGDCLVPKCYKHDPKLGNWVHNQRHCRDSLAEDRRHKLDSLGFVWVVVERDAWADMYHRLQDYKSLHGDCLVPVRYGPDPKLGRWVREQRKTFLVQNMTKTRQGQLESLGFVWRAPAGRRGPSSSNSRTSSPKPPTSPPRVPVAMKKDAANAGTAPPLTASSSPLEASAIDEATSTSTRISTSAIQKVTPSTNTTATSSKPISRNTTMTSSTSPPPAEGHHHHHHSAYPSVEHTSSEEDQRNRNYYHYPTTNEHAASYHHHQSPPYYHQPYYHHHHYGPPPPQHASSYHHQDQHSQNSHVPPQYHHHYETAHAPPPSHYHPHPLPHYDAPPHRHEEHQEQHGCSKYSNTQTSNSASTGATQASALAVEEQRTNRTAAEANNEHDPNHNNIPHPPPANNIPLPPQNGNSSDSSSSDSTFGPMPITPEAADKTVAIDHMPPVDSSLLL